MSAPLEAGFRARIEECNRCDLDAYLPWTIAGQVAGWIRRDRLELARRIAPRLLPGSSSLALDPALEGFAARSHHLATAAAALVHAGELPALHGELYPIVREHGHSPLAQLDRAAVPWFGARAFGVHLNGYVLRGRAIHMWIARRSRAKPTYPGQLDNLVAGGQPIGLSLEENLIKECAEEAAIPAALARAARPVGALTYCAESARGLKPDTLFCYDLELPPEFTPRNTDGEVESFELLPLERVAELVATSGRFKPNCNLVILDFLIRHCSAPAHLAPMLRSELP